MAVAQPKVKNRNTVSYPKNYPTDYPRHKIVIGLTGTNSAGKGAVANYLKNKGFVYYSLSDIIRGEAARRGLEHSRENLVRIGNELREKYGASVLGMVTAEKIISSDKFKFIVDSIRNPAEITELKKIDGFHLIAIDAKPALRFERGRLRGRNENARSVEEFIAQENKEKSSDPNAQQIHRCIELADMKIENNGSLERLYQKVDRLTAKL